MSRLARKKSSTGIYHVMMRGINRQNILHDDEDRQRFIELLKKVKETSMCEIYGYCLMDNHIHLLILEGKEDLSQIMKRIGTSYAYWYNKKYERSGHLFQDRFKSEIVEDDSYFLSVLRYIHQNPLKANIVNTIHEYNWSSYKAYLNMDGIGEGFIDIRFVLGMFGTDVSEAMERYIRYMGEPQYEMHLDGNEKKKCTDDEVKHELAKLLGKKRYSI
jgi:putative transposase